MHASSPGKISRSLDSQISVLDLFVILSGFLMVFHYQLQSEAKPWDQPSTWAGFWSRRFFRIAPLYYVLLAVALIFGPAIYDARIVIDTALQHNLQEASRYEDHSVINIALHTTFLFGLIPDYAFRTALPDWSIGLEMQFYAAFPALMLIIRRFGWVFASAGIGAVSIGIAFLLRLLDIYFPMPSFLPLKVPFFLIGMLCAAALGKNRSATFIYLGLAMIFAAFPVIDLNTTKTFIRLVTTVGFFILVHYRHLGILTKGLERASAWLGSAHFKLLGEYSFGAYLWHLLIMQPVAAWTFVQMPELDALPRFGLVCLIVIPLTYALSAVTFHLIEVPGQRLGKLMNSRRPIVDIVTEAKR